MTSIRGVDKADRMEQGAGDQGMMFGYATSETDNYMPLAVDLSHKILQVLADYRREGNEITIFATGFKVAGNY